MIVKNSNFHVTSTPSCYRFVSSRNEKKISGSYFAVDVFESSYGKLFENRRVSSHEKEKTQRETRFTLRIQTKILKNATHQN